MSIPLAQKSRAAQVGSISEAKRPKYINPILGGDFDGQFLIFREMLDDHLAIKISAQ